MAYMPIKPACHEVPQAVMMMRFALRNFSLLSIKPANVMLLCSMFTRPRILVASVVGCSKISLSMKCG